jgi:hypothetical protein
VRLATYCARWMSTRPETRSELVAIVARGLEPGHRCHRMTAATRFGPGADHVSLNSTDPEIPYTDVTVPRGDSSSMTRQRYLLDGPGCCLASACVWPAEPAAPDPCGNGRCLSPLASLHHVVVDRDENEIVDLHGWSPSLRRARRTVGAPHGLDQTSGPIAALGTTWSTTLRKGDASQAALSACRRRFVRVSSASAVTVRSRFRATNARVAMTSGATPPAAHGPSSGPTDPSIRASATGGSG